MPFQDWHSPADEARFLRTVLDHVSDCLVAIDTQGRIVLINKPLLPLLAEKKATSSDKTSPRSYRRRRACIWSRGASLPRSDFR